jgi:hypothetical protein
MDASGSGKIPVGEEGGGSFEHGTEPSGSIKCG